MIQLHPGVRVYLACGYTDMRRGFDGLAMQVQEVLKEDPFCGAGRQAEIGYQLSGMGEAGEVADFGDDRGGDNGSHTFERLQGLHLLRPG